MLNQLELPTNLWGEALLTACHIHNRITSRVIPTKPYELWKGRRPNLDYFKGCITYYRMPDPKRSKLGARAIKNIFVGYAYNNKAYRLLDKDSGVIVESRYVEFFEDKFSKDAVNSDRTLDTSLPGTSRENSKTPQRVDKPRRSTRERIEKSLEDDFYSFLVAGSQKKVTREEMARLSLATTRKRSLIRLFWKEAMIAIKPEPILEDSTDGRWKWFKNCLGDLDGTYIKCLVPLEDRPRYRTRKGDIATNVLGVCSQDMQFIYVLPGWEGSATDGRVLHDALLRPHGLKNEYESNVETQDDGIEDNVDEDVITSVGTSNEWTAFRDSLAQDIIGMTSQGRNYRVWSPLEDAKLVESLVNMVNNGMCTKKRPNGKNKTFPYFEDLCIVFGKDRANGSRVRDAVEMDASHESDDNHSDDQDDASHANINVQSQECTSCSKKRKNRSESLHEVIKDATFVLGDKLMKSIGIVVEVEVDMYKKTSMIAGELEKFGTFSEDEMFCALEKITKHSESIPFHSCQPNTLVKPDNIPFHSLPIPIPLSDSIPSEIILRTKRPLRLLKKQCLQGMLHSRKKQSMMRWTPSWEMELGFWLTYPRE
ncbi:LOW QUALITY PROTEIN: hypothetical protein OSB04_025026 [Centaurea solstitialis]|uniref:Uncharacterized protein n=1 Tax=Centaurea solstitialis TaxID=347529 RepID=A0AA38SNX8_9ASTR|nr:LOW QUALITY PROTEIN: hypothetical protein OSB04_025026 [Centaurea solstitialis]